jgi:hypothetical protein
MSPHPSSRWQPDLDRCRRRLAELLADEGAPCPELGASALLLRGIAGVDRATWASTRGVSELEVFRMEAGEWWEPAPDDEFRTPTSSE